MPEVHVYVSRADKALLAELPGELTVAQILREAIRKLRAERDQCDHPLLEVHCPACHYRAPARPDDGVEDVEVVAIAEGA